MDRSNFFLFVFSMILLLSSFCPSSAFAPVVSRGIMNKKASIQLKPRQSDSTRQSVLGDRSRATVEKLADSLPMGFSPDRTRNVLAGLVVALAGIPTSLAYSAIVGVGPLAGLWTSVILGGTVALVGGGPGMVAGSAGVIAIPLAALRANYGTSYVSACLLLVGIMQILFGVLKQGYLMKFATGPVITGFLNAFAFFLYNSQLKAFRVPPAQLRGTLGLAGLTAACIQVGATGLTKGVPGSLVGLVLSSVIAYIFSLDVKTLADVAGPGVFSGGLNTLPSLALPANLLDSRVFLTVLQPALGILIISVIETILASKIVSPDKTESDRLCIGLGIGNGISAITGGIGGCGLIPNTVLNKSAGGSSRISVLCYAGFLAAIVLFFSKLIAFIPIPALAGLMLTVAFKTFEWKESFAILSKAKMSSQATFDALSMIATMYLCIKIDMSVGVIAGATVSFMPSIYKLIKELLSNNERRAC